MMHVPRWLRWRTDRELREEIEAHLDSETQENLERGLPPREARYAALRAFGNPARVRELAREASPLYQIDLLAQDVRFALRLVRRTPLLSATIVLTLVLGISLNASVFTILNAFLLRPLVSKDPATFAQIYPTFSGQQSRSIHGSPSMLTLDEYEAFSAGARSLAAVTASTPVSLTLGGDEPVNLRGQFVSCNYLAAHLDSPLLGRVFRPNDCARSGGEPVAVLNERLWRSRFQADPSAVGRTILLNKQAFTIIGIAPNQLTLDVPQVSIWVPFSMQPILGGSEDYFRRGSDHAWLDVSGRLASGSTHRQAQAELSPIAAQLDRLHPGRQIHIFVTDGAHIRNLFGAKVAPVVFGLIMGSFALILLIVCANVTTLLLSRAAGRRQETAIRLSLGAGRGRLLRQLLTESLLLAFLAGAASWWLAHILPGAIFGLSADAPSEVSLDPDWRVFLFTFAAATLAGCLAGLSPALESLRVDLSTSLKPAGGVGAGRGRTRVRRWLIAGQLAASLALLVAAGLIVRVQTRLFQRDVGFDPQSVVMTPLPLSRIGYDEASARAFHDLLLESVRGLPGVSAAALEQSTPFRAMWSTLVISESDEDVRGQQRVFLRRVSPEYFGTLRIALLQGRLFTDAETRTPGGATPVVVSRPFALSFWPNQDPLGQRLRTFDKRQLQVVGVAEDASTMHLGEIDGPLIYEPFGQPGDVDAVLIVRGAGDAASLVPAIRSATRRLDPELASDPETLRAELDRQAERYAFLLKVAWVPSGLALVLCVLGVYGVAAFAAAQRTQEIGIRLAIGAEPRDVIRLLLGGIARPVLAGVLGGLALGAAIGALMRSAGLLLDVHPIDPLSYAAACAIVGSAAFLATFVPVRRASRLDPSQALRHE
jgi:predicted permease